MYENAKQETLGQVEARTLKAAAEAELIRRQASQQVESLGRDVTAAMGPTMGFAGGLGVNKAPSDARRALAGLMDRLDSDVRAGERAKATRENLHALYLALPLEMSESANRALEDLVRDAVAQPLEDLVRDAVAQRSVR
jgi:hypothetical protein